MTLRQGAEARQPAPQATTFEGFEADELEDAWNNYQGRVWRGNAISRCTPLRDPFIHQPACIKKAKRELERTMNGVIVTPLNKQKRTLARLVGQPH